MPLSIIDCLRHPLNVSPKLFLFQDVFYVEMGLASYALTRRTFSSPVEPTSAHDNSEQFGSVELAADWMLS
jgi:hypothetical protein